MAKGKSQPKVRSAKKARTVKTTFAIINVKLLSDKRKGTGAYYSIFKALYQDKIKAKLDSDRGAILRTQFELIEDNKRSLYGSISKFTHIEDGVDWIDLVTRESTTYELPKNLFPNLKETFYCFVPEAHRIAIVQSDKFTLTNALDFLEDALKQVISSDEQIILNVEQDADIFEKILSARQVKKLKIEISYSNADISNEMTAWMDQELRDSQIGSLKLEVTADNSNNILVDNQLINGALGLARSNGEVEANIINEDNKREKIITKDHPRKIQIETESRDSIFPTIVDRIMNIFRPNATKHN